MSGRGYLTRHRALAGLASGGAVLYGALVWIEILPNVLHWHYYPKVWILAGLTGLLVTIGASPPIEGDQPPEGPRA